ncbi:MAG: response regulator, partial [Planctomycetia bacterium]
MPRILVVEDEEHLAIGIKFNLEAEGFVVTTAGDGQTALDLLAAADPPIDLVVLDLMLPGMSGFDVLAKLRQDPDTAGVAVLMLTARKDEPDRIRGLE